jgi:hypothetical protein
MLFSVWIPSRIPPLWFADLLVEGAPPSRLRALAPLLPNSLLLPGAASRDSQGKSAMGALCARPEAARTSMNAMASNMARSTNALFGKRTLAPNENQIGLWVSMPLSPASSQCTESEFQTMLLRCIRHADTP